MHSVLRKDCSDSNPGCRSSVAVQIHAGGTLSFRWMLETARALPLPTPGRSSSVGLLSCSPCPLLFPLHLFSLWYFDRLPDMPTCFDVKLTRSLEVLRVSVNEGGGVDVTNAERAKQGARRVNKCQHACALRCRDCRDDSIVRRTIVVANDPKASNWVQGIKACESSERCSGYAVKLWPLESRASTPLVVQQSAMSRTVHGKHGWKVELPVCATQVSPAIAFGRP